MVTVPILQKEKPRHKGLMTCQDHPTVIWEWQTQDPNPTFQTQRPGPRTYEVADLGLGSKETELGWSANGGEKNGWEHLQ